MRVMKVDHCRKDLIFFSDSMVIVTKVSDVAHRPLDKNESNRLFICQKFFLKGKNYIYIENAQYTRYANVYE